MQLKALKVFCDVVACHSFSRAAEENNVSQSGVSQIINQLETQLGVKLIDRSKRPFVLTAEGQLFYQGCRKIIHRLEALEEEVRTLHFDVSGRVSVASIYSIGLHQLNHLVQKFLQLNPKANVRIQYQHPAKVIELVDSDRVDLGLISYPKSTRTLKAITLQQETMLLVTSPKHRFAAEESLSIRDLDGTDFVGFDNDLKIRRELDRTFAQSHVEPRLVMEFDNIETIKRAIEIDSGVSLLPEPTIQRELQLGTLSAIPIRDLELVRPIGLVYRHGNPLGKTTRQFVEMLEKGWMHQTELSFSASTEKEEP